MLPVVGTRDKNVVNVDDYIQNYLQYNISMSGIRPLGVFTTIELVAS